MRSKFIILFFFTLGALICASLPGAGLFNAASAQTNGTSLVVTQPLDFGTAIVTDNSRQHFIDIQSNGTYIADNIFVFLDTPQEGIYTISGLPPLTAINNITVNVDRQMIGPGEGFIIDNFDIEAPESTDLNGEIVITLGAFMRTTGSNRNYGFSARFESAMTLTLDF